MSVRVAINLSTVRRASEETIEYGGYCWEGRLLNAPEIEGRAKHTEEGNPIREISLSLRNDDEWIDTSSDQLWETVVTVAVTGVTETWTGKVRSWSQDGHGILTISVAEDSLAVFKRLLPDEVVRFSDSKYTNASRGAAGVTIPTVFGGTAGDPVRVKATLTDRVNFRYIVCVGEISQVVAVRKNGTVITTGFTSYTGASGQGTLPGFAYIEFAADPRDEAGTWPDILVDVVGLLSGERNPAKIIKAVLTTADSGPCGWGLGISTSDLDTASFTQAETDCTSAGFYVDGSFIDQRNSGYWLDQLCKACRGSLTVIGGKWTLRIDKNTASSKTYTDEEIELRYWGRGSSSERKNSITVDYRYDPTEGTLLGSATREDSDSITAIGRHSQRVQLAMVRDHEAAGKIADYLLGIQKYGEDRIEFSTTDFAGIAQDTIITVTISSPDIDQLFRVTSIRTNGNQAVIEGRGYDSLIFGTTEPGEAPADPATDPSVPFGSVAPPAVPSGVTLSTGTRVQADGTLIAYIDGIYTAGARTLLLRVEMGEGANPGTWVEVAASSNGTFHVEPVKPNQNYTFRLTAVNTGGTSSAVTANITAGTDTTAPGAPQTPTADVFFGNILVKCKQNAVKAPDLAGFAVYRHTSNNSGAASNVGFAPCAGTEEQVTFIDKGAAYGTTYYYWTKAIDKNGNASGFSDVAGPVVTSQVVGGDLAAGAICASSLFACGVVDACAIGAGAVTAVKTCLAAISSSTGCLNACVVGASQIVDCAVTAAKTCVAAIDRSSGCLNVNTVGACQVIAGSLLACNIAAGTILGCNIAATTIMSCNLCAASITGEKIAACTIYACNIAAGTILGCNIQAGTITGSNIAAGTITASKLLIAAPGAALNADPAFEDNSAHGEVCYGSIVTITDGCVGAKAFRTNCGHWGAISTAEYIPIDPTKCYRRSVRARVAGGTAGASYFYDRYYDACKNYLSTISVNFGCPGASWTTYTHVFQYPAGARYVVPRLDLNNGGAGYVEAQDDRLEEVLPGTLIQDGAITTAKIYAKALISDNWGASCGSCFDLCAGTFKLGGSSAPKLAWDGSALSVCGTVCATSGTFTGDVEILSKGNLLPDPGFDGVPYNADYSVLSSDSCYGEYCVNVSGGQVYGASYNSSRTCYLHCCSNSIWLYAGAGQYSRFASANVIPVKGGQTYTLSGYFASRAGYCCPRVYYCADIYDAALNYLATHTVLASCCGVPSTPTRYSVSCAYPANAAFACVCVLNYQPVGNSYVYVSALQLEEGGTATVWKAKTGKITANQIAAGSLQSVNWGASAGSHLDLNAGCFRLGGSSAPKLAWNGSSLTVCGTICATAGCFTGCVTSCSGNIGSLTLYCNGLRYAGSCCKGSLYLYTAGGENKSCVSAGSANISGAWSEAVLWSCGYNCSGFSVGCGAIGTLVPAKGITYLSGNDYVCFCGTCLGFSASNPYICASSYLCIPNGIYVSGGTFYANNAAMLRDGICNDTGTMLRLHGGTSGFTCLPYGDCSSNHGFLRTVCNDNVPSVSIYKYLTTACCAIYGRAGGRAIIGDAVCNYGTMGYANCIGIFGCAGTNYGVYGSAPNACIGVFGYAVCYAGMFCATCYNGIAAYAPSGYAGVFCGAFPSIYANCGAYILGVLCYQTLSQMSTRESKCDIALAETVLPTIRNVPVYAYRYCNDCDRRWNLGIMADDFACAVPWMGDGRGIPSLGSFAWKGVQELDQCVEALKARIAALEAKIAA